MSIYKSQTYWEDLNRLTNYIVKPKKKTRFLITGASGLIGSFLVDVLLNYSEKNENIIEVYCLGRTAAKLKERFIHWLESENLFLVEHDICTFGIGEVEYDYIIHAASNADPRNYAKHPVQTIATNFKGTENILNYSVKYPGARVLFTSTFEVYGYLEGQDVYSENSYGKIDCTRLRAGYPESKRLAELLARSYHEEHGTDVVIARLSSVYGPTMLKDDSKAHAQFIRNAVNKENIVLKSEGLQKRSYTYVSDTVSGILFLLFHGSSGEIYNIANKNSIASIAKVAEMAASIAGKKVVYNLPDEIEKKGFSTPQNCILDTEKIESLGWRGVFNLEEGLRRTIQIYSDVLV